MSKKLKYIRKEYDQTRTMPGNWYLSSYKFRYDFTRFQPFFEKLKERKLVGNQCRSCNRVFFPPKLVCGQCYIRPDRWVDLRETSQVATYSITYEKDPQTGEISEKPVVAIRQDGSDTTMLASLREDLDFRDVYVGMPLKVVWSEEHRADISAIDHYEPIEDHAKDMPDGFK
ncbi:MAG: Zn-ribbon domain-containing OB-fold protein [Promethearchaeota archaeon]